MGIIEGACLRFPKNKCGRLRTQGLFYFLGLYGTLQYIALYE